MLRFHTNDEKAQLIIETLDSKMLEGYDYFVVIDELNTLYDNETFKDLPRFKDRYSELVGWKDRDKFPDLMNKLLSLKNKSAPT